MTQQDQDETVSCILYLFTPSASYQDPAWSGCLVGLGISCRALSDRHGPPAAVLFSSKKRSEHKHSFSPSAACRAFRSVEIVGSSKGRTAFNCRRKCWHSANSNSARSLTDHYCRICEAAGFETTALTSASEQRYRPAGQKRPCAQG